MATDHARFMAEAIAEARKGLSEGGIPIGSILVVDGQIVGRGHNRRVQLGSATRHAEIDALENAGRLKASQYARSVIYSTLSCCDMCSGACLLYKIPTIVIGENDNFKGPEEYLVSRGVKYINLQSQECKDMMSKFTKEHPQLWFEDIGV
eukprot:TRINITY_DN1367_c0_g1_i1.p1 TRINITY_DN1367_c0_g1~~TRINITY_DN1367_c0_g1_i1.p1  ORF type:complete len:150 (-),score=31.35 TRINITY_DN1367_c0_g1_i1:188-637(-)